MTTVVLAAASDSVVKQTEPNTTYAGLKFLTVTSGGSGNTRAPYIYFNRPFPLGAKIVSAKLRLYQKGVAAGGTRTITVRRVSSVWQESKIVYNNYPGVTGATATLAQGNGGVDGRVWEFDVAAAMQEVSDGAAWYGFRLNSDIATDFAFFSRESVDWAPTLEVEFSDAPNAPQELSPSNGRAVSVPRPVFTFDFSDVTGDDALTAYQVQVNTSDVWTAPTTDTGTVLASEPSWTPSSDFTTGVLRYWRVRVRDLANNWSDWSDSTSFIRTAKPTLAITNPAVAPNDSVFEPLPTFSWTVTGETQTAFQVFVTDPLNPTEVIWDSGKQTSAAGAIRIPASAGKLLSPGSSYSVTVRIWGTVSREATAGDPVYTEASRTFSYGLSGSVGAVSALAVSTSGGTPDARLTWTRATAPDSFSVLRDGVTIAADLVPADLLVSGTSYAWADTSAAPRTAHTWTVLAVSGGLGSSGNPTATGTTSPNGVWLSTTDGTHRVCLSGADPVSFSPSELSEVFKPPGATNPVLITQAVFGREGHVSGQLGKFPTSYAASVTEWNALTNRKTYPRGTTMVLTLVDTAMRVFIYNVVRAERDEFNDFIPVEFDYCELV